MVKRVSYILMASILGALGVQTCVYAATTECEGASFVLHGKLLESAERQVAASNVALEVDVTTAEIVGSEQKIIFRVLNSWKGPFQSGESFSIVLPVTEVCAGLGCVFPFKVGDVTVLLSPSAHNEDLTGCWVYQGVVIQRTLSVPAALMPSGRH